MNAQAESHTRLHGRWLLLARLAWAIVFITLTVMYAFGFLALHETLTTVCEAEPCSLREQIRRTDAGEHIVRSAGPPVGFADLLRPDQVESLQTLGMTLDQYGWLGALQLGLPALVLLLIAAGLFWWKSDDWMALFASVMVATFPIHNMPLAFNLTIHEPAWEWVGNLVSVVALSCLLIFPLIFPTGQFVPRWTRWMAIYAVAGAVIASFLGSTILAVFGEVLGRVFIGLIVVLPFGIGVYAQLYRYFRVARPAERQQFKWVVVGLVVTLVMQFAVLIPLNALLTSSAFRADPARALVLSAIPDTIWQLNNLLIAVCIVISILRYRLWDVDILINRSLVYFTLIAVITGFYVLVVGSLSGLLQNQNDLAAPLVALLIIAAFVQPLRRALQSSVNRLVRFDPGRRDESQVVLQGSPEQTDEGQEEHKQIQKIIEVDSSLHTRLHGRWLLIARLAWIAIAILAIIVYAAAAPIAFHILATPCNVEPCMSPFQPRPDAEVTPQELTSLELGAWYHTILEAVLRLLTLGVALFIFWHRSDDWIALLASIMLVANFAIFSPSPMMLETAQPLWHSPLIVMRALALASTVGSFYLFPDGRFVPCWTRWLAIALLVLIGAFAAAGAPFQAGLPVFLMALVTGAAFQVYRYRRVSNPLQRQQTKWVVLGISGMVVLMLVFILFLYLNPSLNPLQNTEPISPQGAAIFSLMITVCIVIPLCFLPVTLAFSILRYRLWDVDLVINRTLVYGTLTASVVALYVLIVGWMSIGLQTQDYLPGSVFAILVIAFLFQPLRRRLQRIADRFVPVPESTSPSEQTENKITILKGEDTMLRHNRAALVILSIAFMLLTLGAAFVVMRLITPYDDARLQPGARGIWRSNGIVISPLYQQTNGLQKGDLVVAVNGRSLESFAQSLFDWSAPRPRWNSGQSLIYTVVRDGHTLDVAVIPTSYPLLAIFAEEWGVIVFAISFLLIAGFVFFMRPDESVARVLFLGAAGLTSAITWSFGLQVSDIVGAVGWWVYLTTTAVGFLMIFITMLHLALVFPQPRLSVLRWRWLIPLIYLAPYTILFATMMVRRVTAVSALQWLATVDSAAGPIQLVYTILLIIVNARNYVSLRDPISRRQLRWMLFAIGVSGITGVVFGYIPELVIGHTLLSWSVLSMFGLLVPLALAFAILRYRLFDIDVIINRTLVYGALTGIVVSAFVMLVGFLSILFQSSGNTIVAIIATGLVALLFNPLRQRLQRGVNRVMYGERDEPYIALSRLGRRLETTLAPESVLPTVVTTVRDVLRLPYVAIYLQQDSQGYKIVAESASPLLHIENGRIRVPGMKREGRCIPLIHQGETVGYIVLGPRAPNEAFSATDLRLLEDLAPQVGVAVHAVRLTADLQRSREQLVLAREEERRRLRRDLHDGLGPQLAGLALKLETLRNRLNGDPLADSILADLAKRTQDATADVRHLVYELRPPTLDEFGLVMALREGVTQFSQQGGNGLNITFDAPESLPPLPAAVEVAVYRITQEALTNVIRHAEAHNCHIDLRLDESGYLLCLKIKDDGKGLALKRPAGVGLNSMRERAEELGGTLTITPVLAGGTLLTAKLPCRLNLKPAARDALVSSDEER